MVAASVLKGIARMAETVVDAVGVRVAADATVDAAGAADGPAAAGGTVADAADRAEEDTRFLCHGVARIYKFRINGS